MSGDICPNCSSSTHVLCCTRCGSPVPDRRLANSNAQFCSAKCEREQAREDKLSSAIERNEQAARLTAATRRGLGAIRSLADVTATNGIDMTGAEISEMRLAIAWLDKQLSKGRS